MTADLKGNAAIVWRTLATHGPLTARQLAIKSRKHGLHRRLSELRDRGYIEEAGTVFCWTSYRNVIVWRLAKKRRAPLTDKRFRDTAWFIGSNKDGQVSSQSRDEVERRVVNGVIVMAREVRRWDA